VARSQTVWRCLCRQWTKGPCFIYDKKLHKWVRNPLKTFKDVFVLLNRPCPSFPGKDPCPRQKPKVKRRSRRRQRPVFAQFHSRYREKLDPNSNKPVQVGTYWHWRYGTDNIQSIARPWYDWTAFTGQRMWDQTHPPRELATKYMWRFSTTGVHPTVPELSDFGGPMRSYEMRADWHTVRGVGFDETEDHLVTYNGGFVPTHFGNHPDPPPFELGWNTGYTDNSYNDASQYGADGWDRSKPSLTGVDLAAALYELKDLPGQLKTTAKGFSDLWSSIGGRGGRGKHIKDLMGPDNIADHFLNHAFGWVPFLKDLSDTFNATKNFNEAFEQHKRDNGKWIRRRRTVVKSDTFVQEVTHSGHYAYVRPDIFPIGSWGTCPEDGQSVRGYSVFHHETQLHSWFSGTFKYWIPELGNGEFGNFSSVMNRARYYGIRINPGLIYKLTPWSWLGDWFFKVGQVRSAILDSPDDNLVARYAYVMSRLYKITTAYAHIFKTDGGTWNAGPWVMYMDSKHRTRASPFGFGLSSNDLSARQLAILASLGITRV